MAITVMAFFCLSESGFSGLKIYRIDQEFGIEDFSNRDQIDIRNKSC